MRFYLSKGSQTSGPDKAHKHAHKQNLIFIFFLKKKCCYFLHHGLYLDIFLGGDASVGGLVQLFWLVATPATGLLLILAVNPFDPQNHAGSSLGFLACTQGRKLIPFGSHQFRPCILLYTTNLLLHGYPVLLVSIINKLHPQKRMVCIALWHR